MSGRELSVFEKTVRRIRLKRAMGHEPSAHNCVFNEPWDYAEAKLICKPCSKIQQRWPFL